MLQVLTLIEKSELKSIKNSRIKAFADAFKLSSQVHLEKIQHMNFRNIIFFIIIMLFILLLLHYIIYFIYKFQVQNIRAMFQEQHNRLGGSLQNISTVRLEAKPERPKSALGSRKEDEMRCLTPDSVDADTHTYKTGQYPGGSGCWETRQATDLLCQFLHFSLNRE